MSLTDTRVRRDQEGPPLVRPKFLRGAFLRPAKLPSQSHKYPDLLSPTTTGLLNTCCFNSLFFSSSSFFCTIHFRAYKYLHNASQRTCALNYFTELRHKEITRASSRWQRGSNVVQCLSLGRCIDTGYEIPMYDLSC